MANQTIKRAADASGLDFDLDEVDGVERQRVRISGATRGADVEVGADGGADDTTLGMFVRFAPTAAGAQPVEISNQTDPVTNDQLRAVPVPVLLSPTIGNPSDTGMMVLTGAVTPAAAATDVVLIGGAISAPNNRRVIYSIRLSGVQTTAGVVNVSILRRSTVNSGGTSAALVAGPIGAGGGNSGTAIKYSANPTVGTLVGTVARRKVFFGGVASVAPTDQGGLFDFSKWPLYMVVNDYVAINLEGQTITGGDLLVEVVYGEFMV